MKIQKKGENKTAEKGGRKEEMKRKKRGKRKRGRK